MSVCVCSCVCMCVCVCIYILYVFLQNFCEWLFVCDFVFHRACLHYNVCVCASVGMFVNAGWATELQRTNRTS